MAASPLLKLTDRRADERVPLSRRAVLRFDGKVEEADVEDLTRDGCRIRTTAALVPFAAVSIGLAGVGHTPARLVWRDGDVYGCAFEQPLPAGAAGVSTPDNVARFPEVPTATAPEHSTGRRLSLRTRAVIIGGLSGLLWTPILGAAWLLT